MAVRSMARAETPTPTPTDDRPGYEAEVQESPTVRRLRYITEPHWEAIYDALGGPSAAMDALKITRQAIYYLLKLPAIRDREMAIKIDDATTAVGKRVPAIELMKLAKWLGPDAHSPDPKTRRRALMIRDQCPRPESNWDFGIGSTPEVVAKAA